jgi:hypothetical protein
LPAGFACFENREFKRRGEEHRADIAVRAESVKQGVIWRT